MSESKRKIMNETVNEGREDEEEKKYRRLHEWIAQEDFFHRVSRISYHEWMNKASEWMEGINKLLSLMMDIQRFRMLASVSKAWSCFASGIKSLSWEHDGWMVMSYFKRSFSLPFFTSGSAGFLYKSGEVFRSDRLEISKQQISNRLSYAETWFISSFIREETRFALKK